MVVQMQGNLGRLAESEMKTSRQADPKFRLVR